MRLSLKVIVNAKQNEVVYDTVDLLGVRNLRVKVSQPPKDGKANQAVIKLLAGYFKVKKNSVRIINGEASRNKIAEVDLS